MEFEGEFTVAATPEEVWAVISDPEVLVECVPGAEDVERVSEHEYRGTIVQKVAGYDLKLDGAVERVEMEPYERMVAVAKGGDDRAGKWTNLEGRAEMELRPTEDGTHVSYHVDMEVSGRLASIGARLVKPKLKGDIEAFYENIKARVEG